MEVISDPANSETFVCLYAYEGKKYLGTIHGIYSLEDIAGVVELNYIFSECSGMGVATVLLRTLAEISIDMGKEFMVGEFQPERDREATRSWYEKRGLSLEPDNYSLCGRLEEIIKACRFIEQEYGSM